MMQLSSYESLSIFLHKDNSLSEVAHLFTALLESFVSKTFSFLHKKCTKMLLHSGKRTTGPP